MVDSDKIWYIVCWINLLHNDLNVFHLTSIMSLHHLVKLEMLIGHRATNELVNSIIYHTSTVALKLARFESSWLQSVGSVAREGAQNTNHWSGRTETATENGVRQAGSCRHCGSHSSVASSIGPDQWRVFTCNISHMLLSNGLKACEFGGHSWGGINSEVSSRA